ANGRSLVPAKIMRSCFHVLDGAFHLADCRGNPWMGGRFRFHGLRLRHPNSHTGEHETPDQTCGNFLHHQPSSSRSREATQLMCRSFDFARRPTPNRTTFTSNLFGGMVSLLKPNETSFAVGQQVTQARDIYRR